MTRETTIVTLENITITYEMAGLGSRAAAHLLDAVILSLSVLAVLLTAEYVTSLLPKSAFIQTISDYATAIFIVALFVIIVGYFIFFEGLKNGQTPGKKWMGLRVVKEEGMPVDMSGAVVRNLIRIVEFVLGAYIISIIFILFSMKYQRVGDYAAGTIVVKERVSNIASLKLDVPPSKKPQRTTPEAELVRDLHLLTKDQLDVVRRFAERRGQLQPNIQEQLARQIAEPIISRLGINIPDSSFSYANFLEEVFNQSVEEHGTL